MYQIYTLGTVQLCLKKRMHYLRVCLCVYRLEVDGGEQHVLPCSLKMVVVPAARTTLRDVRPALLADNWPSSTSTSSGNTGSTRVLHAVPDSTSTTLPIPILTAHTALLDTFRPVSFSVFFSKRLQLLQATYKFISCLLNHGDYLAY
jgi:hypothetical protein